MAQQNYKKFVASAATATLVASALVPVASANVTTSAFTDVGTSYKEAVDFLVSNNISKGYSETQYGVQMQIKRGDAAVMIANAAGLNDKDAAASGFSDVPTRAALAINSLKAAGVVNGKSDKKFGFEDNLTRGEAAIMLQKAFKLKSGDVKNDFTDVKDSYDAAVDALVANKVTKGINATQFGTGNPIKRGDFAKFLFALKDQIKVAVAVEEVTVVNETTTTVKVKDADKTLTVADFKVLVNGTEVTPTKVESDAKGEVYTITHPSLKGSKGVVSVNGKQTEFNFVALVVETVKADNPREVMVEFSSALDEISATNASNYSLKVGGATKAVTVEYDSKNPKQVKLILSDADKLANNAAVQLEISKKVLQDKTLVGLAEDFKKVWVFNDTVAPSITGVEKSGDDVVVTFNEYVSTIDIVKINGVTYPAVSASTPTKKSVTITNGARNLTTGTYEVLLSGVTDVIGNKSSVQTGTFSVTNDTTAPSVTKINQVGDNTLEVTFDKATSLIGSNNFTVKKGGYDLGVSATTSDSKTYTLQLADAGQVKVYETGANTSAVNLTVNGVKATSNNAVANPYTTSITLSKDKTAPVVVNRFNTITNIGTTPANEVFDIYFDENVALNASFANTDITLTDKDGVRQAISGASVVNDANGDARILRVQSPAVQTNGIIKSGNYNLNLASGVVADTSGNKIPATNVTIAKTTATASVIATSSAMNNVVTINYNNPMTTAATTAANYMLDGKALPTGTNVYFDTDTKTVKIELPNETIKSTGGGVITISDAVVSTNGAKLTSASKTQNIASGFVDNVKPKLSSAKKLTESTIELTFDENIDDTKLSGNAADNDFVIKVNGVNFGYTAATGATSNDNKIVLTTTSAYNTAQAVTVSVTDVLANISITDTQGNLLTSGTMVSAQ